MRTAYTTPDVALTGRPTGEVEADLLVIPVFEDDDLGDEAALDPASGGEIARARARGEFKGKLFDVFASAVTADGWRTPRAVLVGAGRRAELTPDRLRRIAVVGGLAARTRRLARVALLHRVGTPVGPDAAAQALAEGACLANYDGGSYKTDNAERFWLEHVQLRVPGGAGVEALVERGRILGESSNIARVMANEPGNSLTPRVFAEHAEAIARAAGLQVEVLDETRIAALDMGLLLGVARGSQEPPRLVVLRHDPPDAVANVTLAFVGKGITFDTGGISIKPAENMDKMKDDMSGGAAVIAAMAAVARLKA